MKKGTITFYNQGDEFMFSRAYNSKTERTQILEMVRKIYGKNFSTMYYHIRPSVSEYLLARVKLAA